MHPATPARSRRANTTAKLNGVAHRLPGRPRQIFDAFGLMPRYDRPKQTCKWLAEGEAGQRWYDVLCNIIGAILIGIHREAIAELLELEASPSTSIPGSRPHRPLLLRLPNSPSSKNGAIARASSVHALPFLLALHLLHLPQFIDWDMNSSVFLRAPRRQEGAQIDHLHPRRPQVSAVYSSLPSSPAGSTRTTPTSLFQR